jgi:hypothetical protein
MNKMKALMTKHRFLTNIIASSAAVLCLQTAPISAGELGKPILKKAPIEDLSFRGKHRFKMVKSPVRRGNKAQRYEIRHGDCGKTSGYSDCDNDRGRIERKEKPKNSMSKPNQGTWYGYSILIPKDFVSLGKGNTILSQAKVEKHGTPLWALNFNDKPYVLFGDGKHCPMGSMKSWMGKWVDVTVYAHYGLSGQPVYFELYKDGKRICKRTKPIMPASYANKKQKIGLKYGIYSSYVSRYLSRHATKKVTAAAFKQKHSTGSSSKSAAKRPFDYDWGVKLPTHVIYYDEMRYGKTRAAVDVRLLEQAGARPVD